MLISGIRAERPIFEPGQTAAAPRIGSGGGPPAAPFSQALRGVAREIDVGERQAASAAQLRSYDTASLIALQAGIYRYTEAVDLASKIVERATSAVKTVLQGAGH